MNPSKPTTTTFLTEIAPWIRGKKLAIYLVGRNAPITGLTVKHVGRTALVARWNSSTHLVPLRSIAFIRFAPDCDPCRDSKHPLAPCVNSRRPARRGPTGQNPKSIPDALTVAGVVSPIVGRMTSDARTSKLTRTQAARLNPRPQPPEE